MLSFAQFLILETKKKKKLTHRVKDRLKKGVKNMVKNFKKDLKHHMKRGGKPIKATVAVRKKL